MIAFLIRVLEAICVLGLIGSLLVLLLTTFEDVRELFFGEGKDAEGRSKPIKTAKD